jgi:hypothetical protein
MPLSLAMRSFAHSVRCLLPLLVLLAVARPSLAGDLAADLAEIARKSGIAPQRLAFAVQDVRGDRVLAVQNGDAPMVPASNMKVLTTGAALSVLGADFTFNTTLWLDRQNGTARLTLVGSGDPALDDPDLRDRDPHGFDELVEMWSDELKKSGVTRVDELVVDARIFDRESYHPSWPKEQYPNAYCAEVWGLNLARNVVGITPVPQSSGKPTVVFTPAFDIAVERNNATNNAKAKFTFSASRAFGSNALTLTNVSGVATNVNWDFASNSGVRTFFQGSNALGTGSVTVRNGVRLTSQSTAPTSGQVTNAVAVESGGGLTNRSTTGTAVTYTNVTLPSSGSILLNNDDQSTTGLTISSGGTLTGDLTFDTTQGGTNACDLTWSSCNDGSRREDTPPQLSFR